MGYPPYPYGSEIMETPLTSSSKLPSDGETDGVGSRSYQMGPVLQQMLEEFQRGDELLKKEKKGWSLRLGRSKS